MTATYDILWNNVYCPPAPAATRCGHNCNRGYHQSLITGEGQRGIRRGEFRIPITPEPEEREIIIRKVCEVTGEVLPGAIFEIEFYNVASIANLSELGVNLPTGMSLSGPRIRFTTDQNGEIRLIGVEKINEGENVRLTVDEITAPAGFTTLTGIVTLELRVDEDGEWRKVSIARPVQYVDLVDWNENGRVFELIIANVPAPGIRIVKVCQVTGNRLPHAQFNIVLHNVYSMSNMATFGLTSSPITGVPFTATTDANGEIYFANVVKESTSNPVRMDITEIRAPEGFTALDGTRNITLSMENGKWVYEVSNFDECPLISYEGIGTDLVTITVRNAPNPYLELVKTCLGGRLLDGAVFEFVFENLQGQTLFTRTTGADGQEGRIRLSNLELQNLAEPVRITIREITTPTGFDPLAGAFVVTARLVNGNWEQVTLVEHPEDIGLISVGSSASLLQITVRNRDEHQERRDPGTGTLTIDKYSLGTGQALNGTEFEVRILGPGPTGAMEDRVVREPIRNGQLVIEEIPTTTVTSQPVNLGYNHSGPFRSRAAVSVRATRGQEDWRNRPLPASATQGMPGEFVHRFLPQNSNGEWLASPVHGPRPDDLIITIRETRAADGYKQMLGEITLRLEPVLVIDSTRVYNRFVSNQTINPGTCRTWIPTGENSGFWVSSCVDPEPTNIRAGCCPDSIYQGTTVESMWAFMLGSPEHLSGVGQLPNIAPELGTVAGLLAPGTGGQRLGSYEKTTATICDDEFIAQLHEGVTAIPQGQTGILFLSETRYRTNTEWRQRPTFDFDIRVAINNIPVMDIEGEVWLDLPERENKKITVGPDGTLGNPRVDGIRVRLIYAEGTAQSSCICDVCQRRNRDLTDNNRVTSGNAYYPLGTANSRSFVDPHVYTSNNGRYHFRTLRADKSYIIEFEYDGVNYYVKRIGDSHAREDINQRVDFNDGFATIDGETGPVTATNGMILEFINVPAQDPGTYLLGTGLEYRGIYDRGGVPAVSRLRTMVDGLPVRTALTPVTMSRVLGEYEDVDYRMHARTETIEGRGALPVEDRNLTIEAGRGLNAGLRVREVDLALRMNLYGARITINNEEQDIRYDYETGVIENVGNEPGDTQDIARLSIYNSDFHFRFSDYLTGGIPNQFELEQAFEMINDRDILYENREGLRAFVTYKVFVDNQGGAYLDYRWPQNPNRVQADQVRIFYDYFYEFRNVSRLFDAYDGSEIGTVNVSEDGVQNGYRVLSINFVDDNWLGDGASKYFYIEFEVRRHCGTSSVSTVEDDIGNTELPIRHNHTFHNVAEITRYTTEQGMVDRDSSVGNARDGDGWRIEDNVDRSRGVEVVIHQDEYRNIIGIVWEDYRPDGTTSFTHGTGDRNDGPLVDDVVVQLIELFTIEDLYSPCGRPVQFEYIWKETITGSGNVASTASWSREQVAAATGGYTFMNFIPGNYFVRFIYGDGSTRVTNIHQMDIYNVKHYNGQDFQSTIRNSNTQNTAIDNEARRLEVMSHSIGIDRDMGVELEARNNLDATWMAAETYKFHIPVEPVNQSEHSTNNVNVEINHDIVYEDDVVYADQGGDSGEYRVRNFDFGLVRRPDTMIDLTKYLESVIITSHVGDTLFCTETGYNSDNFRQISAADPMVRREERGVWHFYTDVNQLLAGARLEAVYRYVVRNVGEIDFLNEHLVIQFESMGREFGNEGASLYAEYLEGLIGDVVRDIQLGARGRNVNSTYRWLGDAYWTGVRGLNDMPVSTRAETLEESTNNLLTFDVATEGTAGIDFRLSPRYVEEAAAREIIDVEGEYVLEHINQVVETVRPTRSLIPNASNECDYYDRNCRCHSCDNTKLLTLATSEIGRDNDLEFVSHIAEIMVISNAAGRRDVRADEHSAGLENIPALERNVRVATIPGTLTARDSSYYDITPVLGDGNGLQDHLLQYIHSEETAINMEHDLRSGFAVADEALDSNQRNESWAETIVISNPTGGDDSEWGTAMLVTIGISGLAVIGIGTVLIRKFVLKTA